MNADLYQKLAENGHDSTVDIDPESDRLQILHPFGAWDDDDDIKNQIVFKARRKCTTDYASMANLIIVFKSD